MSSSLDWKSRSVRILLLITISFLFSIQTDPFLCPVFTYLLQRYMARVVGGVIVCVMIVAIDVVAGVLSIKAGLIAQNKVTKYNQCWKNFNFYSFIMCHANATNKYIYNFGCGWTQRDSGCGEAESGHHDKEVFKLGLAAAALQAVAHIVANLLGGFMCICCTEELERSTANRQLWFASLALSWCALFLIHNFLTAN